MQFVSFFSRLACFSAMVAIALCSDIALSNEEDRGIEVSVTGHGETYDDARGDAIRRALQQALTQLVIVDRVISNDDVLRDRVLSTSNGYVERYVEVSRNVSDHGVVVAARITVSPTRIQNFIGIPTSTGGAVAGKLINEEMQRAQAQQLARKAQAKARSEILTKIFDDFPTGAYDISLESVSVSPKNPAKLIVKLEQKFKPGFVSMVEGTLSALSIQTCKYKGKPPRGREIDYGCPWTDTKSWNEIVSPYMSDYYEGEYIFRRACLELADAHEVHCYLLSDGIKFDRGSLHFGHPWVAGTFIDDAGRNAMHSKECVLARNPSNNKSWKTMHIYVNDRNFHGGMSRVPEKKGHAGYAESFNLSTGKLHFEIEIDSALVNLEKANHFIAVIGFLSRKGEFYSLSDSGGTGIPCELVNDAVKLYSARKSIAH